MKRDRVGLLERRGRTKAEEKLSSWVQSFKEKCLGWTKGEVKVWALLNTLVQLGVAPLDDLDEWENDWENYPELAYLRTEVGQAWYNRKIWEVLNHVESTHPGLRRSLRRAILRDRKVPDVGPRNRRVIVDGYHEKYLDFVGGIKGPMKLRWFLVRCGYCSAEVKEDSRNEEGWLCCPSCQGV